MSQDVRITLFAPPLNAAVRAQHAVPTNPGMDDGMLEGLWRLCRIKA